MARPRKDVNIQARRGRGKGSIVWRENRKKFQVSRSVDGKRKYEYVDTRKEAEIILKQWEKELDQGLKFDRRNFTIGEYIAYWLEIKRPTVEPNTYVMYRDKTQPLCRELSKVKLNDLTTDKIQKAVNIIDKSNRYAPSTFRTMLAAFSTALQDAVSWGLIVKNPVTLVKLPLKNRERKQVKIVEPEQVAKLLNAAFELGQKKKWALQLWAMISLAVGSGLRHGELAGLLWSDVNFEKKEIYVHRQTNYFSLDGETKFRDSSPKTRTSIRRIVLPDFAISALVFHKKAQLERRLKIGPAWIDSNFVFTNPRGKHITPAAVLNGYKKILAIVDLPSETKLHTLRHTAASIMLKLGIPITTVSSILGHANPSITWRVYAHVVEGDQAESMITYHDFFSRYGVNNDVNRSV